MARSRSAAPALPSAVPPPDQPAGAVAFLALAPLPYGLAGSGFALFRLDGRWNSSLGRSGDRAAAVAGLAAAGFRVLESGWVVPAG